MKPEDWSHVRHVFERCLGLDAEDRAGYVDEACRGRTDVQEEVERLLAEDAEAGDFLSQPVSAARRDATGAIPLLRPGSRLGAFTVKRLIASGGMGTVYEAVQDEPRRSVALKTLRHGLTGSRNLERFHFEAEVLGRLRHPGIAQVYASGTQEVGGHSFPFFAMEFVERARTLFDYSQEQGLSQDRRLRLFLDVCEALQHAHAKGVIHRDLKAGNILVDVAGHPKLIDFGIARAADGGEANESSITLLGTPATMSPEHASGRAENVDVRSDVYSLGCVLHELLVGRAPRDLEDLSAAEAVSRIREEPPDIARELPLEVRWVLQKALATEPEQRYGGVAELAADLRRFLAGDAVEAAPPRASYRLRKLARRHRLALASVAAVLALLVLGLAFSEFARRETAAALTRAERAEGTARDQARAAENALARAEQEATNARETLAFFERTIENVDPQEGGHAVLLADVLVQMAASASVELRERPDIEASIRASIGRSLRSIGLYEEAAPHLERALALRQAGAGPLYLARSLHDLGVLRQQQGRLDAAEQRLRAALDLWEAASSEPDEDLGLKLATLNRLATVHQQRGRFDEAASLLEHGLEVVARDRDPRDREVLMTRANLAIVRRDQGRVAEGVAIMRGVVEASACALGADHADTVLWKIHLAAVLMAAEQLEEADELLGETLDAALGAFGPGHPYALQCRALLGKLWYQLGRPDEAADLLEELLALQEEALGEEHPSVLWTLHNLAMCRLAAGEQGPAEGLLGLSLERHRRVGQLGSRRALDELGSIVKILTDTGRWEEAETLLEDALAALSGGAEASAAQEVEALLRKLQQERPPGTG
jgi:tetratricopeptide (TPR) repeat protein/tRNA A-37 threonylcarbamoyl transferase component Bud32